MEGRGEGREGKGEEAGRDRGKEEGGEGEWGSPTHYFRLKSWTVVGLSDLEKSSLK